MPKEPGEPKGEELEIMTISEMLENLKNNTEIQNKVFGKELVDEDFDEMLKHGVRAEDFAKIYEAMGYEPVNKDTLDKLRELVEKGELKVEDIYIHPEESKK